MPSLVACLTAATTCFGISSACASTYCENTWKAAPTFTPLPICLYEGGSFWSTGVSQLPVVRLLELERVVEPLEPGSLAWREASHLLAEHRGLGDRDKGWDVVGTLGSDSRRAEVHDCLLERNVRSCLPLELPS